MLVVHIINYSPAFTTGFIDFIRTHFQQYRHRFIIYGAPTAETIAADCSSINNHKQFSKELLDWIVSSDLVIVNGVFGGERFLLHVSPSIIKKTYLVCWGGDFRSLQTGGKGSIKNRLAVLFRKMVFNNAAGIINLVEEDYGELCKLARPKGKHFIAPIVDNGENDRLFLEYSDIEKATHPIKILVGNSATATNQHEEIFRIFNRLNDPSYQVLCPLSYGDERYKSNTIELGNSLLGDRFVPLTEYMDKKDYYRILAEVSVCIFNNNRQQALGNIYASLAMGSKVYIRKDTPMWNHFQKIGYRVFDVEELKNQSISEIVDYDPRYATQNKNLYFEYNGVKSAVLPWERVFASAGSLR